MSASSATALASYRNLEEYQRAVRQAGSRVYHHLTDAQKTELRAMLQQECSTARPTEGVAPSSSLSWREYIENTTREMIREKNSNGEPVDANALVEDVLPLAHAAIPADVRQRLFARIFDMTTATHAPTTSV